MPYKIYKKNGYKVCKTNGKKCFSKKGLTKKQAREQQKALYANESLETKEIGSNLEFKSIIPTADGTEATLYYNVKSDPGTDLVLVFLMGSTADESDYLYGAIIDRNDVRGRMKKFEDPHSAEANKIFATYKLTPEDIEMAGQDGYERIEDYFANSRPKLNEPYEEGLSFFRLFDKIIAE